MAQRTSSRVDIVTVYSQNGQFHLRSVPYDNESPNLYGVTQVFESESSKLLYTLQRAFDEVADHSNALTLSDDGQTILYVITSYPKEDTAGLKSISIYRRGELVKDYTASQVTGCDLAKERCDLRYSNYGDVVDKAKSNFGTINYKKTFKTGVSDQEKFLSDYPVFSSEDIVYITDSKKNTHRFSLSEARHLDSKPFIDVYEQLKAKTRTTKADFQSFDAPTYVDFPKLQSGVDASSALARALGMKVYDDTNLKEEKYKSYRFKISGFLQQNGSYEVTDVELYSDLPKDKIVAFFAGNKFVSSAIPTVFDKWFVDEYFYFRKADNRVAVRERQQELKEYLDEAKRRSVAETIQGRYIPKDLGDALVQLDKELSAIDRNEMAALSKREEMISYHFGLGTWMRNNWGLWSTSRLQKYFMDKGVTHPEDMSSVILYHYWDWLQGKKDAWKEWEKNPKSVFDKK